MRDGRAFFEERFVAMLAADPSVKVTESGWEITSWLVKVERLIHAAQKLQEPAGPNDRDIIQEIERAAESLPKPPRY